MNVNFVELTDIGNRDTNQDYFAHKITEQWQVFILADGLGGHAGGERIATEFCLNFIGLLDDFIYQGKQKLDPKEALLACFDQTLLNMRQKFFDDALMQQAHTTCAIVYFDKNTLITLHIGDTRIYRISPQQISRTRDHSVPQMLLDEGDITEAEMANHPDQNRLTRSISLNCTHRPSCQVQATLKPDEALILCSDGFWSMLSEKELQTFAKQIPNNKFLAQKIKIAIKRAKGKSDNVTVQWIKMAAATSPSIMQRLFSTLAPIK